MVDFNTTLLAQAVNFGVLILFICVPVAVIYYLAKIRSELKELNRILSRSDGNHPPGV